MSIIDMIHHAGLILAGVAIGTFATFNALRHTPAPKPIAPGVPRDPLLDSIIDYGYTAARVMAVMGVAAEADLLNHDHAVMRNLVIDIRPLHRAGLVMCVHPLPDGRAKVHFVEAR